MISQANTHHLDNQLHSDIRNSAKLLKFTVLIGFTH